MLDAIGLLPLPKLEPRFVGIAYSIAIELQFNAQIPRIRRETNGSNMSVYRIRQAFLELTQLTASADLPDTNSRRRPLDLVEGRKLQSHAVPWHGGGDSKRDELTIGRERASRKRNVWIVFSGRQLGGAETAEQLAGRCVYKNHGQVGARCSEQIPIRTDDQISRSSVA
jgi:hypothetical protein